MMYRFFADFILIAHALFVAFVILGFVFIVIGLFKRWSVIDNVWFRITHLAAIFFVVTESWVGGICPLTDWENRLRVTAGGAGYSESFIQHWLQQILFYDFPPWIFTAAYTAFGLLVLLTWMLAPPRLSRR